MKAIDQVCLLHPVDRTRIAMAGLSAGASMAALLVTRYPERFKAVMMHSADSTVSALGAMHGRRATMPLMASPVSKAASWPQLMVIGPRGERRSDHAALRRRSGARCIAHGVGICRQAVSRLSLCAIALSARLY